MSDQSQKTEKRAPRKNEQRLPYEKPAIIYKGKVTTRAGSPLEEGDEEFDLIKFLTG